MLTYLEPLDAEALKRILTEPKNAIVKQYQKLFKMDGIDLVVDPEVYQLIVDKAIEYKLGARGLRAITENIMLDAMYNMPSTKEKTLHVTLEYAKAELAKANLERMGVA